MLYPVELRGQGRFGHWCVFPDSVRLANLPQAVSFTGFGSPTHAQTIALKSLRTNRVRYVIIAAVTGRVRLSDSAAWESGE